MPKQLSYFHLKHRQKGVVLFVSLMILLVLTLLGLSAMNISHTELQITSNQQEKNIAYQASQAGINAVMCLAGHSSSQVITHNPFDKKYTQVNVSGTQPLQNYNWSWDQTYDSRNVSPFNGVTQTDCSVSSGSLSIGNGISNDLTVAVRRTPDSQSLRKIKGNSYKELACQNYVIDSRYDYQSTGANSYNWAGVCREKINN